MKKLLERFVNAIEIIANNGIDIHIASFPDDTDKFVMDLAAMKIADGLEDIACSIRNDSSQTEDLFVPEYINDISEAEQAKENRRKYQREYRQKNKDKVKKWNQNYWLRRTQKEKEKTDEN